MSLLALTLHGPAAGTGLALGALTATGQVAASSVDVGAGGVGTVRVGDELFDTRITLADPAAGALTRLLRRPRRAPHPGRSLSRQPAA